MKALGIVETFDVIEDGGAGFLVGGELPAIDQFPFEGAPETFHGGIADHFQLCCHTCNGNPAHRILLPFLSETILLI